MRKENLKGLLTILIFYMVIEFLGVTCPIKFVTGISCAGCGMSRAWISLLKGNFMEAFHYHPLFLLPVPALLLFLIRKKISKKVLYICTGIGIAVFLITYGIRILDPSDQIVVFHPSENIFTKISILLTQRGGI